MNLRSFGSLFRAHGDHWPRRIVYGTRETFNCARIDMLATRFDCVYALCAAPKLGTTHEIDVLFPTRQETSLVHDDAAIFRGTSE